LPRNINPNVKAFLSIHKHIYDFDTVTSINIEQVNSLVIVDTNSWSRIPEKLRGLKQSKNLDIHIWDHHPGQGTITPKALFHENTGANISIMVKYIQERHVDITPIQATLFLIGLYEDTGNLTFSSTTSKDAYTAAYLLDNQADLNILSSFLSPAYGEKQKSILFNMLKSSRRSNVNGFEISFSRQSVSGHVDRLAVVVQMYREIINVDAAFGIFERENGSSMVIGRSITEDLNIGSIMKSMGGGGHPGAGSAMLKNINPDAIEEMIIELINGNQKSSVRVTDLMSFPVFSVAPDITMAQLSKIFEEKGCTGFPVLDNQQIVGVISRRDLNKIKKESQWHAPVKAFMSKNIQTIEPWKSPMQAARLMVKYDIGRLPVVDNGEMIGIVTRSDAMTYFYDLLPE